LTTNRIEAFDPAFESRIHLTLYYTALNRDAREQIWNAFLNKVKSDGLELQWPTQTEIWKLSNADLNGRQIKNVMKLALALADSSNESFGFQHLFRALNTMQAFDFQKAKNPPLIGNLLNLS
jgi:SpoVK/Ycf46/Vps4 family AAA+-type ATPase